MPTRLIIKSSIIFICFFSTLLFADANHVDQQSIACSNPNATQSPHDFISSTVTKIFTIQSINIGRIDEVKKFVSIDLADRAKSIYSLLENRGCKIDDGTRTAGYKMLRVLAVMNEIYPNKEWTSDTQLMEIFESIKKIDPVDTELLRKQDWSREL